MARSGAVAALCVLLALASVHIQGTFSDALLFCLVDSLQFCVDSLLQKPCRASEMFVVMKVFVPTGKRNIPVLTIFRLRFISILFLTTLFLTKFEKSSNYY